MRVHGIARRTLFDPTHDEQPFCQNVTERRRTTVRFLGQQSEMSIDDTWRQAGEMRSLWKGTTEFGTNGMPQDDTWKPNRHHSNIFPRFRNRLTRNAGAMFPPPLNPVASTEHEWRDHRLPAVPHTEDAEEKGRRVVLGMSEPSNVYSSQHHDPSGATESQDAAAEAADPCSQRQGMSAPPGQPLSKWHGKGTRVSCAGPSSTTRARSLEPASRSRGNW